MVLAIEDVHWADASSLALTRELARLCDERPLVLYLIARPEAETALDELVPGAQTIHLEPLDETGVGELVAALLEGRRPAGLVALGRRAHDGNPFFVEELVRSLREHEILDARRRRVVDASPGWDEARCRRRSRVSSRRASTCCRRPAADVLQTASVIGGVSASRSSPPSRRGAAISPARLETLVQRGFLDRVGEDDGPTVVFHHALVQDVAYSRLLRRHGAICTVVWPRSPRRLYGAGDDVLDLLARHLYLGEAGAKAIDYLVRAGERARRLFANEEAILHFGRAAELVEQRACVPRAADRDPALARRPA